MTTIVPSTRRRTGGAALLALALLAALAWVPPVALAGTTITVNTVNQEINGDGFCSLQEAIYAANRDDSQAPDWANPGEFFDTACPKGNGHDIIELPPMGVFTFADPIDDGDNFIGPTVTPIITSDITIEGRGARLQRLGAGRLTRAFAVGPFGFLDLREVHIKGFSIHGGNGNDGGGGGMGAGGAIFVTAGELLVQWSTFEDNTVTGGNGGFDDEHAGGGGGGLSGDGGDGINEGGGGGGARGNGAGGGSIENGVVSGAGGGRITSAVDGGVPGQPCGARGNESDIFPVPDGADNGFDSECSGGGASGGTDREPLFDPFCGGAGGNGKFGGGGGGGGADGDGGDGGFGGGGGGNGGFGGFGGGGGSEERCAAFPQDGQGGTFAGDGGTFAGGGGAGLGGAIFGYLSDVHVINSTFAFNGAYRGHSGGDGRSNDGRGAGGAIFTVAGDLKVESSTFSGNETRDFNITPDGFEGLGGGAIVVYDPEGSDEATLVLRNSILANNGPFECYTRNGVTTTGSANNIITHNVTNSSDFPRCPGVLTSVDPGLGLLQIEPTGRTPTMAIGATSSATNVAVAPVPADDQRGTLRPQGSGPDIGAYEFVAPSPLPPVTTIALTPPTPNGSNGWYTSTVAVSVTAFDFDGDLDETRCSLDQAPAPAAFGDIAAGCAVTSVATDGQHVIHAASNDLAGNVESPVVSASLKIDATDPVLAPSLNVATVAIGQTGVVASANASDATSGVASESCGAVDSSTPGVHTLDCTATDNAGNTASSTLTYVVEYRVLGFFSPVPGSHWRVGQTVPIKVALGDANGTRISDAAAQALARACRVQFVATGAQSKTGCLKYSSADDQFIFNWKLGKSPSGAATIMVVVTYPGTTWTTVLSEPILITQ